MDSSTGKCGLVPLGVLVAVLALASCNDQGGNDNGNAGSLGATAQVRPSDMPPGTLPGCSTKGKSCLTTADCCGFGVCDGAVDGRPGFCNDASCIQNGDHCMTSVDCCEVTAVCVGAVEGSPGFCRS